MAEVSKYDDQIVRNLLLRKATLINNERKDGTYTRKTDINFMGETRQVFNMF